MAAKNAILISAALATSRKHQGRRAESAARRVLDVRQALVHLVLRARVGAARVDEGVNSWTQLLMFSVGLASLARHGRSADRPRPSTAPARPSAPAAVQPRSVYARSLVACLDDLDERERKLFDETAYLDRTEGDGSSIVSARTVAEVARLGRFGVRSFAS